MNALVAKEVRLLLPAYGMAVAGAALAGWMMPEHRWGVSNTAMLPLLIGAALVALSSFGREFALNTYGPFMAQPLERTRVWQAKFSILAVAEVSLLGIWLAVGALALRQEGLGTRIPQEVFVAGFIGAVAMFAGGLWTTLLLRQVTAAFWFTVLAPGALLMLIAFFGGGGLWDCAVLLAYSIGGVWWARRYFQQAQEVPWSGTVVALPGWRSEQGLAGSNIRGPQPFAALFWKEVRLHQLGLLGIAYLFVLHLVVVLLRKAGLGSMGESVRSGLEAFGGIWLLVPFLVSAQTVAEERRVGTADALTCLPVSLRKQFLLKLAFVLVLGGVLCPVLLWAAELLGLHLGAGANIGGVAMSANPLLLLDLVLLFAGLSLAGFYGSTLGRNVIQALAAGMGTALVLWFLAGIGMRIPLLWYVGLPIVTPVLLYFSWRNFARPSETGQFLMRNCVGAPVTLAVVILLTMGVYFRIWEFAMPLEPAAHGPARFSLSQSPALKSYGGNAIVAVLPGGRLWQQRIAYHYGQSVLGNGTETGFAIGGRWMGLSPEEALVPGSTWVQAVASASEVVAIASDGSLWVSERPVNAWADFSPSARREPNAVRSPAPLVRFGTETGWKSVTRAGWQDAFSVILLREDGSLWRWGWLSRAQETGKPEPESADTNNVSARYGQIAYSTPAPAGLRNSEPQRLGAESDWARMMGTWAIVYLWKKDGTAWVLHGPDKEAKKQETLLGPDMAIQRGEIFDNTSWRSLAQMWAFQLGVREDGTLWGWYNVRFGQGGYGHGFQLGKPVQIGTATDWVNVAASWRGIATLKSDGTIWEWDMPRISVDKLLEPGGLGARLPRRLGSHNDWVAIAPLMDGILSLAADGNLWFWWGHDRYNGSQPMVRPSRRPEVIASMKP